MNKENFALKLVDEITLYIIRDKLRNREVVNISKLFCFILYFSDEVFLLNNSCPLTGVFSCFACRISPSSHFILFQVRLIHFRLYDLKFFTHHPVHGASGTVLDYVTELFSFSPL